MTGYTAPLAPLVLFAYNRPEHTARCLASLAAGALARYSALHVFVDGPRAASGMAVHEAVCAAVAAHRSGFADLVIHRRECNMGLASSVIDGVSRLLAEHPSVIVLEDDLFCAPGFLEYMNAALRHYAADTRVGSIHGYCYPGMPAQPEYYFMKGGDCWGWATWRDRWKFFEPDGRRLLTQLLRTHRLSEFTLGFTAPYMRLLCRQILGRNNSWAIRWHASLFLRDCMTLYPASSLVQNTGLDGSGTHCDATDAYEVGLSDMIVTESPDFPEPAQSAEALAHFRDVFSSGRSGIGSWLYRGASLLLDMSWLARVCLHR